MNDANLNVHLDVPVMSKTGRGMPFVYKLSYDSSVWYQTTVNSSLTWTPVSSTWGWKAITAVALTGYVSYQATAEQCTYQGQQYNWTVYAGWTYHDPYGVSHYFPGIVWSSQPPAQCGGGQFGYSLSGVLAVDGSGYVMSFNAQPSASDLSAPNGMQINAPLSGQTTAGSLTDSNGNLISISNGSTPTFTNTLGTTALTTSGSGTPSSPTVLTYTNPLGGNSSYTVHYTAYTVQTAFGCSGVGEYGAQTQNLVSSITLSDSTTYSFTYETTPGHSPNVTGRIASITLPTGGLISYSYSGGSNGITCADGTAATLKRTTPDGAWTYAHSESGNAGTTTITDPASNVTTAYFQTIYETQRTAGSPALKTTNTCYSGAASPCNSTAVTLPITQVSRITTLGTSARESRTVAFYNSYGLPTELDEYDYGSGAPGSLTRKTVTVYNTSLGNGIVDRPSTVTTYNGAGATVAQTTYSYDQGSVVATSGTPQHVGISGSRGNATTVSRLVAGTTTLNQTFTYFDTGNVQTVTDVNSGQTTYAYGNCGKSFVTSATLPLSLSRSYAWNCTGGVMTSATDENSKTATTAFSDANFWRPTSVQDPMPATTSLAYAMGPTAAESTLNFNGATSTADARITLDGLGRTSVSQRRQGQGSASYDSVQTKYDSSGRVWETSAPYSGTAGAASGSVWSTTTYDALNRPTQVTDAGGGWTKYTYNQNDVYVEVGPLATGDANTKKRQLEYDGLGRLTSVCEISIATGSGSCGQNVTQTGFWTKYTYDALDNLLTVTQNAQSGSTQTRTFTYDGLGRLTSDKTPETNQAAYNYTFDTDATCGTSNGDLVKRADPVGGTTCYAYDSLHRVTAITYSGGYTTDQKHFVYDTATVDGTAMTNVKARLAEAYTGTSGSKITDLGFSYSNRGEVTEVDESTPHSGGYYHLSALYWANGLLDTLNTRFTGLPTWTYAPDGERRASTVSATRGQNPVTATTYNLFSLPTAVTYGSVDTDAFSFDANTGRMTQYKAVIGAALQSTYGTLTWNANGSLSQNAITDPFNAINAQSCAYVHDDLARIASADCGSGKWGQSFIYDAFGHISKSVLSGHTGTSFMPLYSSSTNRYTQIGSSTPTYDSNGNPTWDTFHYYGWDNEGKLTNLDSGTVLITYDRFGRRVEQNKSSVYTQMVYGPDGGKLALMNGQTVSKVFVPLPGGGTAVYNSSGLSYYRHSDWLGSSRLASTTGRAVYYDSAYNPFGEPFVETGTTDRNFTGQNQELTTDEYDFLYREYHAAQGRWISPDPAGLAAVDATRPQTWNRYAYTANNPLASIDPLGVNYVMGSDRCIYYREFAAIDGVPQGYTDFFVACLPDMGGGSQGGSSGRGDGMGVSGSGLPPKTGTNTKSLACSADVAINFGFGFIPGYNAVKVAAALTGISFKFVEAALGYKNVLTAGPSPIQAAAGATSAYSFYRLSIFMLLGEPAH